MIWVQISFHTFFISSQVALSDFSALFLAYISTQGASCVGLQGWDVEDP